MSAERWRRVETLLAAAIEIPDARRPAYLDATCGDDAEVRRRVERLLEADRAAADFLASPPFAQLEAALAETADERRERDEPAPGDTVGRYRIERKVGEGGMGAVYAARDPELEREIALKLVHLRDPGGRPRRRLLREAQALARVSHPNVVTVHDVGSHGDAVFVAMEYVPGGTLEDWLRAGERGWREVVAEFAAAGRGLAAAHAAGIVHRDFKPANVLRDGEGRLRVADFGLARRALGPLAAAGEDAAGPPSAEPVTAEPPDAEPAPREPPPPRTTSLTGTGWAIGTPTYMAPEQYEGGEVGPACDQFAFCVALYHALYGEHPFGAGSPGEIRERALAGAVAPPPRDRRVPGWLRVALLRGLAPRPEDRWASMSELVRRLERGAARRGRRWTAAAALAIVPLGAAAWFGGSAWREPPPAADERPTENLKAYSLYLKGRMQWNLRTADGLRRAADLFRQAIDEDPDFALAWSGLADAYTWLPAYDPGSDPDALVKAREAGSRALELAPDSAEAHASMGSVLAATGDGGRAEAEFLRAIELRPDYASAHHWYGALLTRALGRPRAGVTELELARELDPGSSVIVTMLASAYSEAGMHRRALETEQELRVLDPEWRSCLARDFNALGRWDEALATVADPGDLDGLSPVCIGELATAHHFRGDYEAELALARRGLERHPGHPLLVAAEGGALAAMHRVDDTAALFERVLADAAPASFPTPGLYYLLGELRVHGHAAEARALAADLVAWYRARLPAGATDFWSASLLSYALIEAGRDAEAAAVLGGWLDAASPEERRLTGLPERDLLGLEGWMAALAGRRETALRRVRELDSYEVRSRSEPFAARIYAALGDRERALRALEDRLSDGLVVSRELHLAVGLESLRADPRFPRTTPAATG